MNTANIKIANDVLVTVPDAPCLMTNFVLREQHDWFEDEIRFIRTFIKPGMQVIDIGANYGAYALSMAKLAGDTGKVWAFEPTENTAACLRASIRENSFSNIELIQAGLSDRLGQARLYTSPNSELNSLSKEAVSGGQYETIRLLTLDHCLQQYGWQDIDFIKLDAEGEELNILKKGKQTLGTLSPLVMFELKHGKQVNLPLINRFNEMGYSTYRLVPGLNTLVEFDPGQPFDGYLLNLFCCKNDKAQQLEATGVMVRNWQAHAPADKQLAQVHISGLKYAAALQDVIQAVGAEANEDYRDILNAYIAALQDTESVSQRVGYLMFAVDRIRQIFEQGEQNIARLVTFSRIAFAAGERSLGVRLLTQLLQQYQQSAEPVIDDLLLPAAEKYEDIDPGKRVHEWLLSSIIEQYIIKHAFSNYFSKGRCLPLYEELSRRGFMDEEMARRYQQLKSCISG